MLHRIQQLRIDPGQPRQRLRIQAIVFLPALPDQPHLSRVRHDHFMPQLAEQADSPRASASRFPVRSDCAAWHRRLPATLSHSYGLAAPVVSAQLHPPRSTNCYDLPDPIRWSASAAKYSCSAFAATVLTFFIAGLLFICALSTSITWERTASRPETGLLIPSVLNKHCLSSPA